MRKPVLLLCLAAAACGEPARVADPTARDNEATAEAAEIPEPRPVRIGEYGAAFRACGQAGTTRNLKTGEALPVRLAPFENAGETGSVAAGARFFICSRSLDQKWFGIVFDEGGSLAERCGVSEPVTRRRDYDGPCGSGWVQSAFVKVIAGEAPLPLPPAESANVSEAANSALPGT